MAEESRIDIDATIKEPETQLATANNQETKLEATQEISSHTNQAEGVNNNNNNNNEEETLLGDEDKRLLKLLLIKKKEDSHSGVPFEQDHYGKIGWVPPISQRKEYFIEYYCMPKEFSVGPFSLYHEYIDHKKNKELKVKLAAKFIQSFSRDKTGESLLKEIRKNIHDLKKYLYEPETMYDYGEDDSMLARFLFWDGCAVLQFIHSYLCNELEEFGIDDHRASLIREDLFLLDNQIPFKVLQLLVNVTSNHQRLHHDINAFLQINNIMMLPVDDLPDYNDIQGKANQSRHLLDLLHSLIISADDDVISSPLMDNNNEEDNNMGCLLCCSNQVKSKCCLPHFACFQRKRPTINNKRFFRNVQELKSAGIEFKPSSGLGTISFSSKFFNIKGHLKLPPLTVDEWTKGKLMNLVAYEMVLGGNHKKNWFFITSYIKFMDFLIDREEDVKELRASHVLWNRLSSDKEVADLFNQLGSESIEPPKDVYLNVRTEIQIHCGRKCASWMAQVYQEHFSSPWTMVALFAAAIVLSLTAIQTVYAVHPKN